MHKGYNCNFSGTFIMKQTPFLQYRDAGVVKYSWKPVSKMPVKFLTWNIAVNLLINNHTL